MRTWIEADILRIHADDVPSYKKQGSIVRNSFFWALRSISAQASRGKAWEFETAVWFALQRMLTSFTDSGYLATRETQLEFREDAVVPGLLQSIATWIPAAEFDDGPDQEHGHLSANASKNKKTDESAGQRFQRHQTRLKPAFKRKAKQRPEPEERPAPPYSSYIKKP